MSQPKRPVRWPGNAYDPSGQDLSEPLEDLLFNLNLLEDSTEVTNDKPFARAFMTPPSLQVITAGAAALSKGWTAAVGTVGGVGAIVSAAKGLGASSDSTPVQRAIFVASAAIVLAATVIAIALIVRADVMARAEATAAEYQARARVVGAVVNAYQGRNPLPTPTKYWLRRFDDQGKPTPRWYRVVNFKRVGDNFVAVVHGDSTLEDVAAAKIAEWRAEPD